jgi:hypothetical protein
LTDLVFSLQIVPGGFLACFLIFIPAMAGVYRPRHPERTVLYRVLFHHFDRFVAEYEGRSDKDYGYAGGLAGRELHDPAAPLSGAADVRRA